MGVRRDLSHLNTAIAADQLVKMRREQAEQRELENDARARTDPAFAAALEERRARADAPARARAARADARVDRAQQALLTPLAPGVRVALIVLAVLSAVTVVGLPITAVLVVYLVRRSDSAVARRRAELGLDEAVTAPIER